MANTVPNSTATANEHEQTDERLLAFRLHHYPLFPKVFRGRTLRCDICR